LPQLTLAVGRRRRARRSSVHHQNLLIALLDSLEVAVVACGADGRLTHASRGAGELLGAAGAPGSAPESWIEHLRPRTPEGLPLGLDDLPLMRALEPGAPGRSEILIERRGFDVLLEVRVQAFDDGERKAGAVAVLSAVAA